MAMTPADIVAQQLVAFLTLTSGPERGGLRDAEVAANWNALRGAAAAFSVPIPVDVEAVLRAMDADDIAADSGALETLNVAALIEVKLTPEREGGFDRLAERIAKFDQVSSCYLMSGGYDLAVFVEGEDLREVARFVTEKLSTLDGVLSTATHFQLKVYKQSGFLAASEVETDRLAVTP